MDDDRCVQRKFREVRVGVLEVVSHLLGGEELLRRECVAADVNIPSLLVKGCVCFSNEVNIALSLGIDLQLVGEILVLKHPELVMEDVVLILRVKLSEIFQGIDSLLIFEIFTVRDDVKIVVS